MVDIGEAPTRGRAILLLGAIFFLGAICGAVLFHLGQWSAGPPHPPGKPRPPHPLEHMSRELDLDPEQREAIRSILEAQRERLHDLLEDSRQEIRALLRPEQLEIFDTIRPPGPGGAHGRPPDHPRQGRPPPPGHGPPPGHRPPPGDRPPPPPEGSP